MNTTETKREAYQSFLAAKHPRFESTGFTISDSDINPALKHFQRDATRWTLAKGKAACFMATGLGKTIIQLEWARHVHAHTQKPVLILAPLAVAPQTRLEGVKFGIDSTVVRSQAELRPGINITNYDMLDKFDPSIFGGVVCDESSVMKDWTASTTQNLRDAFIDTPFKLCCSATPSPNDHTELGTHAEFLGVMTRLEMLSMYFCHDGGNTSEWRLKGHARKPFWRWMASWAISARKPSDLGYDDTGYDLPTLHIVPHVVAVDHSQATEGKLFRMPEMNATGIHKEMRLTAEDRARTVAEIVALEPDEQWFVLCNTDYEAKELRAEMPQLVEVKGSDAVKLKEQHLLGFTTGNPKDLLTKPSLAAWGLNYQHCARIAIAGLSYSFEQMYQVIRRCWRFGQTREVYTHIVYAETEGQVYEVFKKKEAQHEELQNEMNDAMREIQLEDRHRVQKSTPTRVMQIGEGWRMINGDCIQSLAETIDESIHYSIFSPPFASLYVYSDADADLGNCKTETEFFSHFAFLIDHLHRVLIPGRLVSVHCMDLPTTMERDGYTGLKDFSGQIIWEFQRAGFIYHSRVAIWKDPLVAATRTKAIGLLHKQLVKDSSRSRQGIADYLITFRKPGDNPQPVSHGSGFDTYAGTLPDPARTKHTDPMKNGYSHIVWQRYASPVWMDIDPSDTLQRQSAREEEDERHIAPLQLGVIQRGIELWTNPGDLVLSPFAGIGSEGYVAVRAGRRFLGIELKESYFDQAVLNLRAAEKTQHNLFTPAESATAPQPDPSEPLLKSVNTTKLKTRRTSK